MSLQLMITFNEDDVLNIRDYSTNGREPTTITGLTIGAADILKAGIFNGSTTELNYGDILDFEGTNSATFFAKINITAGVNHFIYDKDSQYKLSINSSNKVVFTVNAGAGGVETLTSTGSISGDTWTTIAGVYDGTNMIIYIDGEQDSTLAKSGNFKASSDDFLIGSDGSVFLTGKIETGSVFSDDVSIDGIVTMDDRPGGLIININDSSAFALGDLVTLSAKGSTAEAQGVITGDLGSNQMLYLPIANDIPQSNDIIKRVGNIFNTTRQWISESIIESAETITQIKDRVDTFLKASGATEGTVGYRYTREALKWKTATCPDFPIRPVAQVGSIDDFNPTDIAIANTLYISSTTPVSWTGLQAPSPVKPQLIFIINDGTKNITIRNNDASSIAANRFSLNTNVILSPNDCGFLLYDENTSRWRVNKI